MSITSDEWKVKFSLSLPAFDSASTLRLSSVDICCGSLGFFSEYIETYIPGRAGEEW